MSRLSPIDPASATGLAKALLEQIEDEMGMVPTLIRVMANSPAVLHGFLSMQRALDAGVLDKRLRYQIALATSQANGSAYCVAAYSALGKAIGLSEEALRDARRASSPNRRTDAALKFARALENRPGPAIEPHLAQLRAVGFDDSQIAEIVAHVVFTSLSNYFYHASRIAADFPPIDLAETDE